MYLTIQPRSLDPAELAAAQELFAALPVDVIPGPAGLPTATRMPFSPNPFFVGRASDLRAIARGLKGGVTAAIGQVQVAAASGLGGIGKSQLASEFVHRYGQYFAGGVYWLSFGNEETIPAEVAACGGIGGMDLRPDYAELSLREQLPLVLAAWQSPMPRLLVFDNCEEEELVARWRPSSGGCRILITSRRSQWDMALGIEHFTLGVLSRAESISLLRKHCPGLGEDPNLDSIAAELGDLPLALHLAGSFLNKYRFVVTTAGYLAELRSPNLLDHHSMQGGGFSPTGHEQYVARTFALSYERLDLSDSTDTLAMLLLARAAYFAPGEPIPRLLLVNSLFERKQAAASPYQVEDALMRLVALGLLEDGGEGALRLHRLLAVFVRAMSIDESAQLDVERALGWIAIRVNDMGFSIPLLPLQTHLRSVTDAAKSRVDEQAARLCQEFGEHLSKIGDFAGAQPYYERALEIREALFGKDNIETANNLSNLGLCLYHQGKYDEARPFVERALRITEVELGDHPDTAKNLNNLGLLLRAVGDLAEARGYYERSLTMREIVFEENHEDIANSLHNLGLLLHHLGKTESAQSYLERALAMHRKKYGNSHPMTAISLNALGGLLHSRREYEAAQSYYDAALSIFLNTRGENHPDTANVYHNLGKLFADQGVLEPARRNLERALSIRLSRLSGAHPDLAETLNSLGWLLHRLGEDRTARPMLEQALAIKASVFGDSSVEVAIVLNNYSGVLQTLGDHEQALWTCSRALRILKSHLGAEHPQTQTVQLNFTYLSMLRMVGKVAQEPNDA
jgi:tetratricopeptide (TPR) repeat protein